MAFKMRTGTASEFGNGSNMSEGEIVNVKSGLTTENGGAMFFAPRDGVPERVVTDVDQTIQSDLNFTGTISKNGTALTPSAAEINRLSGVTDNVQTQIDGLGDDITALNTALTQSYTSVTKTNAYGSMTNRYVKIGKLVVGQVDVTPNQTISTSVGDYANVTDAPPAIMTTCTVHLFSNTEQKTQYVVMRPNRTWSAFGAYTANQTVSGVYCYMTS